jgi:hypothetical protein
MRRPDPLPELIAQRLQHEFAVAAPVAAMDHHPRRFVDRAQVAVPMQDRQ